MIYESYELAVALTVKYLKIL